MKKPKQEIRPGPDGKLIFVNAPKRIKLEEVIQIDDVKGGMPGDFLVVQGKRDFESRTWNLLLDPIPTFTGAAA